MHEKTTSLKRENVDIPMKIIMFYLQNNEFSISVSWSTDYHVQSELEQFLEIYSVIYSFILKTP